jgi:hypothetical protein
LDTVALFLLFLDLYLCYDSFHIGSGRQLLAPRAVEYRNIPTGTQTGVSVMNHTISFQMLRSDRITATRRKRCVPQHKDQGLLVSQIPAHYEYYYYPNFRSEHSDNITPLYTAVRPWPTSTGPPQAL